MKPVLDSDRAGAVLEVVCAELKAIGFAFPPDPFAPAWVFRLRLSGRLGERHYDVRLEDDLTLSAEPALEEVAKRALVRAEARVEELAYAWGLKERPEIGPRSRRSGLAGPTD